MRIETIDTSRLGIERPHHPAIYKIRTFGENGILFRCETKERDTGSRVAVSCGGLNWAYVLAVPMSKNRWGEEVIEDCRVFHFKGNIMFCVTDRERIGIGRLHNEFAWLNFDSNSPEKIEKNWQFFQHGDDLYGIRWIAPTHEIYRIILNYETGHEAASMLCKDHGGKWDYGTPHGGTPPVRYGDLFVSIFHSFTIGLPPYDPTQHTLEQTCKEHRLYFAAPYAFEAKPPFRVVMWPKMPMLSSRMCIPLRDLHGSDIVFPCGLIRDGDNWTCSYSEGMTCCLAHFTTEELFNHLTPI